MPVEQSQLLDSPSAEFQLYSLQLQLYFVFLSRVKLSPLCMPLESSLNTAKSLFFKQIELFYFSH